MFDSYVYLLVIKCITLMCDPLYCRLYSDNRGVKYHLWRLDHHFPKLYVSWIETTLCNCYFPFIFIRRGPQFFISLVRGPPWSAFWKFSWSVVRLGPLFSKFHWSASGPRTGSFGPRGPTFRSVDPCAGISLDRSVGEKLNAILRPRKSLTALESKLFLKRR